ncbi:MAG TPA: Rne/Rng family ribonuclease [Candidatus Saccharimonadales bacterium]|nr:Rne/Rng family ribonuclease [Candidatus Saccharimonadales bacterium]
MNKELYVSTSPHETKVALVEDDQLAEVYFERENEYTLAGSIYKGRVTRVLPGMQSAFVDIGLERDAFLYVSDFLELQDEEEDAEFGDVKVTGSTLAHANGMILAEPEPVEEEAAEEPEEDAVAEGGSAQAEGAEGKDGAPRWRGRRRRRGRRGGRDRINGDRPAEAQPGTLPAAQAGEQESVEDSDKGPEEPIERRPQSGGQPRKRELRGFEPRGLVVHGLNRTVDDSEELEPEVAAEVEVEPEVTEAPVASAAEETPTGATFTPMLLPGESISKYNRADGETPAAAPAAESGASEEQDRGYSRGRDRGGDRDRGGRGRRGDRDRDRGRGGRDRDRDREPREPREREAFVLPENYTPIVLPGESISKYRGVEPVSIPESAVDAAPSETVTVPEAVESFGTVAPVAEKTHCESNQDEPLASASYSGASGLPSLTQRHDVVEEINEEAAAEPRQLTQESMQEPMLGETAAAMPTVFTSDQTTIPESPASEEHVHAAEPQAEAAHAREAHEAVPVESEPVSPEQNEAKPNSQGRRTWRDRVSKIFGATPEGAEVRTEQTAGEDGRTPAAEVQESNIEAAPEVKAAAEKKPAYGSQFGSFVIEGGHVEHEELDADEAEMPALAEHFDRYEEDVDQEVLEEGNGSQLGSAVRESGEESAIDDEEYDFEGEEFEESELLADGAVEEEEQGDEQEEAERSEPAVAREPGVRQRPERFERRERRGRRGAPPQRGGGRMRPRQQSRALPLISELLKEGQEILVQIAKEPIGKKGARITSHIALPGRFLVYMPTVNHIGVSRKISSEEERQRLKRIVSSERENGHGGFIVRTAASNIKEDELRADIRFLKHLWTEIKTRAESSKSPALIYHDLNLVERILRDQVTSDFSQIWVDNESEYERVVRFASRFQPNLVRRIKLYTKDTPLYEQFGINDEINKSLKSKVWLKSGGYIVINQTEALVAIDINTGKYVGKTARLEDTIVKTNCDAVKEIVRQIRLRDLGGIIVVDFIDMDERKNRQKVMQALEEAMKADRAPSKILQFNDFGLVAITRKRVKQSLERTLGTPCPYCDATGFVKSVQTICNEIYVEMRKMRRHIESKEVILRVNPEVAKELKAGNGKWLQEMEELIGHPVLVKSDSLLHQEKFDMNY